MQAVSLAQSVNFTNLATTFNKLMHTLRRNDTVRLRHLFHLPGPDKSHVLPTYGFIAGTNLSAASLWYNICLYQELTDPITMAFAHRVVNVSLIHFLILC